MFRLLSISFFLMALPLHAQTAFDWQAHRGGRGIMPENTWPAFEKALSLPVVTTLELDVVVSKDGQVVVSHEPFFSADICRDPQGRDIPKADEKKFNLYQYTYAEIKGFDCGLKGNAGYPEQKKQPAAKPLLAEVLQLAERYCRETGRPAVAYNIEIKSTPDGDGVYHPDVPAFSRLVHAVIRQHVPLARVTLQCFDFRVLRHWHEKYPDVALAALVANRLSPAENIRDLGFTPAIYSPHYLMLPDKAAVAAVHALHMRLVPWTVNEVAAMQKLKDWGVDGLITDYPDRIAKVR